MVLLLVVVAVVDVEIANTSVLLKMSSIKSWHPAVFLDK